MPEVELYHYCYKCQCQFWMKIDEEKALVSVFVFATESNISS